MRPRSRGGWLTAAAAVACGVVLVGTATAPAVAAPSRPKSLTGSPGPAGPWQQRQRAFTGAAQEFGLPEQLLLAVSYNLTRWEDHAGRQSADGGYGPMDLAAVRTSTPDTGDGKGNSHPPPSGTTATPTAEQPLDTGARELKLPAAQVKTDPAQNIRAGAALLAGYARALHGGRLPTTHADWYPAVARYAGATTAAGGQAFADDVFNTMRLGAQHTTPEGQTLALQGDPKLVTPDTGRAAGPGPECPPGLDCRFVPAAYDWSSADHSDPNNYGNYDPADRPQDGDKVKYIVIHDTEGVPGSTSPYDQAIKTFQNPASFSSAHYVIRSSDGQITQMVPTKDVAWHAGNWTLNEQSIGIEHEGYAAQGGTWYTEQMYQASARLVRYLAAKYHIPLDRKHIIGHEDIPRDVAGAHFADAHWDPGAYWDWSHYMDLLGAPIRPTAKTDGGVVTINPNYATNQPPLQDCSTNPCTQLPPHGANFVYLHTEPRADSPLITDPVLHPDGSPGTTSISDWSDKAVAGRSYAVAGRSGEWTAIWYGGQRAWLDNPGDTVAVRSSGEVATPKPGAQLIPMYGRAFPEQSAYPSSIPFDPSWQISTVPWNVPSGQSYVVAGRFEGGNYFARFDPANVPANHTLVEGPPRYLLLSYNHRYVFVQATDVEVH